MIPAVLVECAPWHRSVSQHLLALLRDRPISHHRLMIRIAIRPTMEDHHHRLVVRITLPPTMEDRRTTQGTHHDPLRAAT